MILCFLVGRWLNLSVLFCTRSGLLHAKKIRIPNGIHIFRLRRHAKSPMYYFRLHSHSTQKIKNKIRPLKKGQLAPYSISAFSTISFTAYRLFTLSFRFSTKAKFQAITVTAISARIIPFATKSGFIFCLSLLITNLSM